MKIFYVVRAIYEVARDATDEVKRSVTDGTALRPSNFLIMCVFGVPMYAESNTERTKYYVKASCLFTQN